MATNPTNNRIPSESPRDLKFNAGKIDEIVNSQEDAYRDRMGLGRLTWAGIENISREAISKFGYVTLDSFEDGATVTTPNQVLRYESTGEYFRWDGALPKTVPANSTPDTSGGQGAGKWLSVGSAVLSSPQAGSGDALVAVKQPLNGSVARTQHDKNLEVVSVMDFGAVGDGSHDDTAAFQAAAASGARWVVAPRNRLYRFTISDEIVVTSDRTSFDMYGSEIRMLDSSGLKSHFVFQSASGNQLNGNTIRSVTLVNEYPSTVYQIRVIYAAGLVIEGCTGYSPSYGHVYGFIELNRVIISYIRQNQTERMKDSSVLLYGTGLDGNRTVDAAVYDNRFVDGDYAIKVTDYVEGVFTRRNITYAQRVACIGLVANSLAAKTVSVKIQENDFDSPNLTGSFLFMRYASNVQVTGGWFAGTIAGGGAMIRLEQTDGVIISDAQAYPTDAFILDNGVGTTIVSNMIVGGTVACQFGPLANRTLIASNNIRGVVAAVAADQHLNSLSVLGNRFEASSAAITENTTNQSLHTYSGNSGDSAVGSGLAISMTGSPFTYTVGGRSVIMAFKGGTITNISVNSNQMATSSNVTLGPIPPGSVVQVSYTGATPGLQILKTL